MDFAGDDVEADALDEPGAEDALAGFVEDVLVAPLLAGLAEAVSSALAALDVVVDVDFADAVDAAVDAADFSAAFVSFDVVEGLSVPAPALLSACVFGSAEVTGVLSIPAFALSVLPEAADFSSVALSEDAGVDVLSDVAFASLPVFAAAAADDVLADVAGFFAAVVFFVVDFDVVPDLRVDDPAALLAADGWLFSDASVFSFSFASLAACEPVLPVDAGVFAFATLLTFPILTVSQMTLVTLSANARILQGKLSPDKSISTARFIINPVGASRT